MPGIQHNPDPGPARPLPEVKWTSETFPNLIERLFSEHFTGKLTLDFYRGVPRVASTTRRRVQIKGLTHREDAP